MNIEKDTVEYFRMPKIAKEYAFLITKLKNNYEMFTQSNTHKKKRKETKPIFNVKAKSSP